MADKYSDSDAVDIIENEGLGYAVHDYCSGDSFASEITGGLWDAADAALEALVWHLKQSTGREVDA